MRTTRKAPKLSMPTLQKLVAKHHVTRSGSMKQVAARLVDIRGHVMPKQELDMLEDFLKLPPSKRYKGTRWTRNKKGVLVPV